MQIGIFYIDISWLTNFFEQSAGMILWQFFAIGVYLYLVRFLLQKALKKYLSYRQKRYRKHWKWVLLAVDIPSMNVQTPKAIEQMFSHLAGAFDQPDIAQKFRGGYCQRWFSFEIISIGGYIQFLVRTEETFRHLVEAAMYAQYPEAEITEVEDYVENVATGFPENGYDMWAADFGLEKEDAYPLRIYREFEHTIAEDTVLKDPMGAFLESFSRISQGEQMWFQILVEPISSHWKEKSIEKVKELIGEKKSGKKKQPLIVRILVGPVRFVFALFDKFYHPHKSEEKAAAAGDKNELKFLTPGQTKVVEAIEEKMGMIGYKTKMRGMYLARKEVFRPSRGVHALIGAINQFNIPTSNSLIQTFGVNVSYFRKEKRQQERKKFMMNAYKNRSMHAGGPTFVLNVAELATIWHFPMSHVKTPMVKRVENKQSEPPMSLPVEQLLSSIQNGDFSLPSTDTPPQEQTPNNLPLTDGTYPNNMNFG